ncbi:unnamed protein product, partial [Didymodactylos carnosus]
IPPTTRSALRQTAAREQTSSIETNNEQQKPSKLN